MTYFYYLENTIFTITLKGSYITRDNSQIEKKISKGNSNSLYDFKKGISLTLIALFAYKTKCITS